MATAPGPAAHIGQYRLKAFIIVCCCALVVSPAGAAAATSGDERRYDSQLMRLAEILGSIHYLRELCGANDGQRWRLAATKLIETEGTSALRRATIAKRFNLGYRSYRRTYRNCTPSAKSAIGRFLKEAVDISDELIKLGK